MAESEGWARVRITAEQIAASRYDSGQFIRAMDTWLAREYMGWEIQHVVGIHDSVLVTLVDPLMKVPEGL